MIHTDITTADGEFDIFQKISLADVQRVAKTYFTPESRVVMHIMPKGAAPRGPEVRSVMPRARRRG